jgi:ribose transport system permease protein
MATAGLIGALNGVMIVKAKIPPFVMTLGSMSVFRGLCYVLTSGYFVNKLPEAYVQVGRGSLLGISNNVLAAFALFLLIAVLVKKSKYFRQMFYIGASPRASFLSGIPSGTLMILGYVLCSLLAGMAGILMTSRLAMGHAGFGGGAELRAIAAAVIGGASMAGGEGSILGTALGVMVIALINNVFIMFNGSSNWQAAISGLALLIAISIDVLRNRLKKQTR